MADVQGTGGGTGGVTLSQVQGAASNTIAQIRASLTSHVNSIQNNASNNNTKIQIALATKMNQLMANATTNSRNTLTSISAQIRAQQTQTGNTLNAVLLNILKPSIDRQTQLIQKQTQYEQAAAKNREKQTREESAARKNDDEERNVNIRGVSVKLSALIDALDEFTEAYNQKGANEQAAEKEPLFRGASAGTPISPDINPLNPLEWLTSVGYYLSNRTKDVKETFDGLGDGQFASIDAFRNSLFGSERSGEYGELVFFMLMILPLFKEIMQATHAKEFSELNFLAIRDAKPARTPLGDAFRLYSYGQIDYPEFEEQMLDSGWSNELIPKLFASAHPTPNISDLYELYRRKEITRKDLESGIKKWGFDDNWNDKLQKLSSFVPPVQDVIRFMVRDVFDERLAQLSGVFQGWDNPEYLKQASRAGILPEDAKNYWAAHWILPSFGQGFELFQREIIDRDTLESLFRAGDLAPLWREKMLEISYNLPTRVDVRRAYEDGVINDDRLKEYLRHSGVAPDWQQVLFDWHVARRAKIQGNSTEQQTFSLSQIIKGYVNDIFTESEAIERLVLLGWDENDARTILQINAKDARLNISQQYKQDLRLKFRKMAENGYRSRTLSKSDARELFIRSGIDESQIEDTLLLIDKQYEIDRKTEIIQASRKLYLGYEISENIFFDILNTNGFSQDDINEHLADLRPLRDLRYRELTRADIKKGAKVESLGIEWGKDKLKGLSYSDITIEEILLIERWNTQDDSRNENGETLPSL